MPHINIEKRREYRRLYAQQYRIDNLQKSRAAGVHSNKKRYILGRAFIDGLKSKPCMDCGGCFPPECMDFDHRDPTQKRFNVSRCLSRSFTDLKNEADKCDLVCANCHRVRTRKNKYHGKIFNRPPLHG